MFLLGYAAERGTAVGKRPFPIPNDRSSINEEVPGWPSKVWDIVGISLMNYQLCLLVYNPHELYIYIYVYIYLYHHKPSDGGYLKWGSPPCVSILSHESSMTTG